MHTTRSLRLALAAPVLAAALAGLTACSGTGTVTASGTAQPAGVASSTAAPKPTTAAPSPSRSSGSSGSTGSSGSSGSSCGTSGSVPAGAGRATTVDLDRDGRKDQIWLADSGSTRRLGVRTVRGAVFSTTYSSAAPQAATAVAGIVDGDIPVILLDTGRSVSLYTVSRCAIRKVENNQGQQYTFDKGFTGYGTGVGCPSIGSERRLVGYDAKNPKGSTFDVTRTLITLRDGGTRASNGTTTTIGRGLTASSSTVKTAQSVTCGSGGQAGEPQ